MDGSELIFSTSYPNSAASNSFGIHASIFEDDRLAQMIPTGTPIISDRLEAKYHAVALIPITDCGSGTIHLPRKAPLGVSDSYLSTVIALTLSLYSEAFRACSKAPEISC